MRKSRYLAVFMAAALVLSMLFAVMPGAVGAGDADYKAYDSLVLYDSAEDGSYTYSICYPEFMNFDKANKANALVLNGLTEAVSSFRVYADENVGATMNGAYAYEIYGDLLSFSLNFAVFDGKGAYTATFSEPFVMNMKTGEVYGDLSKALNTRENVEKFTSAFIVDAKELYDGGNMTEDAYNTVVSYIENAKGHVRFYIYDGAFYAAPTAAMFRRNVLFGKAKISSYYPTGMFSKLDADFVAAEAEYDPEFDYSTTFNSVTLDGQKLLSLSDMPSDAPQGSMLPLSIVTKAMGYDAAWDEELGAMVVSAPSGKVKGVATPDVKVAQNADGDDVNMKDAPVKVGDEVYVTVNFFSDVLGYGIIYANGACNFFSSTLESTLSTMMKSTVPAKSAKELVDTLNQYMKDGNLIGSLAYMGRDTVLSLADTFDFTEEGVLSIQRLALENGLKVTFALAKNGTQVVATSNDPVSFVGRTYTFAVEEHSGLYYINELAK